LAELFPQACPLFVGHIGDGNIHFNASFPLTHFTSPDHYEQVADQLREAVYDIAVDLGGSISAEHGIGQKLPALLPDYKSAVEMEIMRDIKHLLDPMGILNPGKVLVL
jgi:D-lactate dehydrogenase (cytochrome)